MAAGDFHQHGIEEFTARWQEQAARHAIDERYSRAANPDTEANSLRVLARDSEYFVRSGVAANAAVPPEVLAELVRDPSHYVRSASAENPILTVADATRLAGDESKDVRQAVASRGTGDVPAQALRERVKCNDSWGRLELRSDAVEFRRWGRHREWIPLDGIEPEALAASGANTVLALTWLSGQKRKGPLPVVGGRWKWCRPHLYGDLQIRFEVADAEAWVRAIRVNRTKSLPAPRRDSEPYEPPFPTVRQMQHEWYGTHSELNWRDRVLGEQIGYPDADSYVQGFKEHDPS